MHVLGGLAVVMQLFHLSQGRGTDIEHTLTRVLQSRLLAMMSNLLPSAPTPSEVVNESKQSTAAPESSFSDDGAMQELDEDQLDHVVGGLSRPLQTPSGP
jgi:hypothetical protein